MRICFLIFLLFTSIPKASAQLPPEATCAQLLENQEVSAFVYPNLLQIFAKNGWALNTTAITFALIQHYAHSNLDYAYFERFFRKYEFPLYLVANSEPLPPGYGVAYPPALAPHKQGSAQYYLWVGVGEEGSEEAAKLMKELGITETENLERLRLTGLMIADGPKPEDAPNPIDLPVGRSARVDQINRLIKDSQDGI